VPDDVRQKSEELFRYYGELARRIGQGGIADIADMLALFDQLKRALDAVSPQELLWADEQARQLIDKLVTMNSQLEAMRRLKSSLSRAGDGGAPSSSRSE
jgi:hypothetical protein